MDIYVISSLNGEEIIRTFYEKRLQKTNQKELRIEKVIKRKVDKLYIKWKGYDNSFNSWIDKISTKADIKNISHVDTSSFALKTNSASLKTEVDKLDIDKLVSFPVDLSKLSDVIENDVVKKTVYDKLFAKVNNIDTNAFVSKIK